MNTFVNKEWSKNDPVEVWKSFKEYIIFKKYYDIDNIVKESENYENKMESNHHKFTGTYKPFKITKELLKSKKIEILFIENLYELVQFEQLEEIENLYVMNINFNISLIERSKKKLEQNLLNENEAIEVKKYLKVYEILSNIRIKNLNIRFMQGHLSVLKHFKNTIKNIDILICSRMNDFDFSFVKNYKKIPKINLYIFDLENSYLQFSDINNVKNKIYLEGKKTFKFNYSYAFQVYPEDYPEDVDVMSIYNYTIEKVEFNWLPITENFYL